MAESWHVTQSKTDIYIEEADELFSASSLL